MNLHLASAIEKMSRYGPARNRDIDPEPRDITITDDEAVAVIAALEMTEPPPGEDGYDDMAELHDLLQATGSEELDRLIINQADDPVSDEELETLSTILGIDVPLDDGPQPVIVDYGADNCPGGAESHVEFMALNGECPNCGSYDKSKWRTEPDAEADA